MKWPSDVRVLKHQSPKLLIMSNANSFNYAVRASFTSLAEQVNKRQDNFREVVRIFQAHEEYIVKTGEASQEMAQNINAFIRESEKKTLWIGNLMRDAQEKTRVLRQHEF